MTQLIETGSAMIPEFDFLTGKRKEKYNSLKIGEKDVIVVEGLHAPNPASAQGQTFKNIYQRIFPYLRRQKKHCSQ